MKVETQVRLAIAPWDGGKCTDVPTGMPMPPLRIPSGLWSVRDFSRATLTPSSRLEIPYLQTLNVSQAAAGAPWTA